MPSSRFVALLRGINVGGNNIIPMRDLKACFEAMGFSDVQTYIQSGNVIFSATKGTPASLEPVIEQALAKRFNYGATVVVLAAKELHKVIAEAPKGFGASEDCRYDVLFVKRPLTTAKAFAQIPRKEGVDHASMGAHALYFSRLISKATQSKLNRIAALPCYKLLTIRNWNTTKTLEGMMNDG